MTPWQLFGPPLPFKRNPPPEEDDNIIQIPDFPDDDNIIQIPGSPIGGEAPPARPSYGASRSFDTPSPQSPYIPSPTDIGRSQIHGVQSQLRQQVKTPDMRIAESAAKSPLADLPPGVQPDPLVNSANLMAGLEETYRGVKERDLESFSAGAIAAGGEVTKPLLLLGGGMMGRGLGTSYKLYGAARAAKDAAKMAGSIGVGALAAGHITEKLKEAGAGPRTSELGGAIGSSPASVFYPVNKTLRLQPSRKFSISEEPETEATRALRDYFHKTTGLDADPSKVDIGTIRRTVGRIQAETDPEINPVPEVDWMDRLKSKVRSFGLRTKEEIIDKFAPVEEMVNAAAKRKVIQEHGGVIPEGPLYEQVASESNPLVKASMYGRKVTSLTDLFKSRLQDEVIRPLHKAFNIGQISRYVNAPFPGSDKPFPSTEYLNQYLKLERTIELNSKGVTAPANMQAEEARAALDDLRRSLDPDRLQALESSVDNVHKIFADLRDYAVDAGLWSAQKAETLAQEPHYLPMQRIEALAGLVESRTAERMQQSALRPDPTDITEEIIRGSSGSGSGAGGRFSVGSDTLVKKQEGSTLPFDENALEGVVRYIQNAVRLGERNKVARAVGKFADENPDMAFPARDHAEPAPIGMRKISFLEDGNPKAVFVDAEVGEALLGMSKESVDAITRNLGAPLTNLFRTGATQLWVPFMIRNIWRDIGTGLTASRNEGVLGGFLGFNPLKIFGAMAAGAKGKLGHVSPRLAEYEQGGAGMGGFFRYSRPEKGWKEIEDNGLLRKVNPVKIVRDIGEIVELGPRMLAYEQAMRETGNPEFSAMRSARSTIDFQRSGTFMKLWNMWVPFLNARTQGAEISLTALRDQPQRMVKRLTVTLGVPALAARSYMENQYPGMYQDINEEVRDNYVIFPWSDRKDDRGRYDDVWLIPKSEIMKMYINPVEQMYDAIMQMDPDEYRQAMEGSYEKLFGASAHLVAEGGREFVEGASPIDFFDQGEFSGTRAASSVMPLIGRGVFEHMSNRDLYFDSPIVSPPQAAGIPWNPEMIDAYSQTSQGKTYNSKVLALAEELGVAPQLIRHYAESYGGSLGKSLTANPENIGEMSFGAFTHAQGDAWKEELMREADAIDEQLRQGSTVRNLKVKAVQEGERPLNADLIDTPEDVEAIQRNIVDMMTGDRDWSTERLKNLPADGLFMLEKRLRETNPELHRKFMDLVYGNPDLLRQLANAMSNPPLELPGDTEENIIQIPDLREDNILQIPDLRGGRVPVQ